MLLEEKQIPYKIEKINMRSYGDKPEWFLKKVPSGLLPVIEIDGQMMTESLKIMQVLDATFPSKPMLPQGPGDLDLANKLLKLERELFGAWCSFVFRPGGLMGGMSKGAFEAKMDQVEKALAAAQQKGYPWLLGTPEPTIVDLQYISHVERMAASVLYWRGVNLRNNSRWPNVEKWFAAFEERESYLATKSDYYTHVRDIPPQYGDGYSDNSAGAKEAEAAISGGQWHLPLAMGPLELEPLAASMDRGDEAARHEAAWKIVGNHTNVVKFAARGMGKAGKKRFQAPLADPYAEPAEDFVPDCDAVLRATAYSLLVGTDAVAPAAFAAGPGRRDGVQYCVEYLRERVGVPRDMGQAAAMNFRAHLNHAIKNL